ncbi:hypothetical protein FOA52_006060 [Chlamydomonas sp. UWO 241]|nr:hypothetical protein FOA52_006060 [Chlamydomonas sp. UWO 241]
MARNITGDEFRRQKELDDARKAGLAPAALDEEGKEINPHIPEYMTTAPWYLNKDHPTLSHQRNWKQEGAQDQWYDRGAKAFQATKFRKGACENCGSMTHKTKDCLERPRDKGAKWTGKNIAADDKVQEVKLTTFEAKRDRWNGYDAKEYGQVVDRYEKIEEIRKELKQKETMDEVYAKRQAEKAEQADKEGKAEGAAGALGGIDEDGDDDAKIVEDEAAGFSRVAKMVRTTGGGASGSVRNLRIREDTAKYLLNLDLESAHYDPKTRSMREDPQPDKPNNEKTFQGDNFVRHSGDYSVWQQMQVHSMDSFDKGTNVHGVANPSLAEMMYKQFKQKKEVLSKQGAKDVAQKYGDAGEKMPDDVAQLLSTERYVEYDRNGRVVKGQETKIRSRYEEDVCVNNHTAVWGSWWSDGTWGYACCHQSVKNSYCTGAKGAQATAEVHDAMAANMAARAGRDDAAYQKRREESKLNDYKGYAAGAWGSETADPASIDPEKVKAALKMLEEKEKAAMEGDATKRKFNSIADAGGELVSAEEMEAFRLKKGRTDDPLAQAAAAAGTSGYDLLE